MVLNIAKQVVVRFLEKSDDPEVRKYAAWIKDAEKEAVDLILDIITDGVRRDGKITSETAGRIRVAQGTSIAKRSNATSPPVSPFLEQYLDLLRTIVAIGSMRKAIYLQGFLHTSDCSSLWFFESDTTPKLALTRGVNDPYQIGYSARELKIFVFERMTDENFRAKNKAIGDNY